MCQACGGKSMYVRVIGAIIIVFSTSWIGIDAARKLRKATLQMQELRSSLERMECEIRYARTPYHKLCKLLGQEKGSVGEFFLEMANQPGKGGFRMTGVTRSAAKKVGLCLPPDALRALEELMDGFGGTDAEGQIRLLRLAAGEGQGLALPEDLEIAKALHLQLFSVF